jgi:hypothetical protein
MLMRGMVRLTQEMIAEDVKREKCVRKCMYELGASLSIYRG